MTESVEYDLDDEQDEQQEEPETPLQRKLRRQLDKANREIKTLKREKIFGQVGLNMEDPVAQLFTKSYDGDLSPEAIRAEAAKYNLVKAPRTSEVSEAEEQQWRVQSGATRDDSPPAASGVSYEDFERMPMTQRTRFLAQHPNANEVWQQGKTVPTAV